MTSKWLSGPALLWQNEDEWPVGLKEDLSHPSQVMLSDPEVKGVTVLATENTTNNQLLLISWNISPIGSMLEGPWLYVFSTLRSYKSKFLQNASAVTRKP